MASIWFALNPMIWISSRARDSVAAVATATQTALTSVYWQQMVRYLERRR